MSKLSLSFAALWVVFVQSPVAAQCPQEGEDKKDLTAAADQETVHRLRQAEKHYRQALSLLSENKETEAEGELRSALHLRPTQEQYVRSLTHFHIKRKHYDEAIQVIKNYVDLCGATALGYELQGEVLFQQKQYGLAFESLQASLALSPKSARAHQLVGLIYTMGRNYPKAVEELRMGVEQNPSDPQIRYFLGRVLYTTGS